MIDKRMALVALAAITISAPAHANVTISTAATQNMSCSGGTCVPTATNAVLNAVDLQNDLSQFGNLTVTTTGSGVEANNIVVNAAFSSPDSTSLMFDAHNAITINAAVSIGSGTAELELQSDTGKAGMLLFGREGNVAFGSLSDIFGINGGSFTLVGSVQGLASAVAADPAGAFALANDYDASADGTYTATPVPTSLSGTFEGLGHVIKNLTMDDSDDLEFGTYASLFAETNPKGSIRDVGLTNVKITVQTNNFADAAALVGYNQGRIVDAYATGAVNNFIYEPTGGLVAYNVGTIDGCYAAVNVAAADDADVGGLVGSNAGGQIAGSFATGDVSGGGEIGTVMGGLVGDLDDGTITDSYATGNVTATGKYRAGGLIGFELTYYGQSLARASYSTGTVPGNRSRGRTSGGSIGIVGNQGVRNKSLYWDTTTSGASTGVGAGSSKGVVGMTTEQLQSGLPAGFHPKIWTENPNVNNGLPYLINNPPPD